MADIKDEKQRLRMHIWSTMERMGITIFPRPCFGRIPNFIGSIEAAKLLCKSKEFEKAEVVFVNPDSPQRFIREIVLRQGKMLIMPTPRLKEGFLILNSDRMPRSKIRYAATIRGAFKYGIKSILPPSKLHIDLKVVGSVAVSLDGARLGKGGGYSDLEYAILRELELVDETTPIITTVHPVQIVKQIPMTKHDVPIDAIYTPRDYYRIDRKYKRPKGIYWDEVSRNMIESNPILKKLRGMRL
ncbi:MAG: 5-formyltetrahydrofolate cyclo-ligase [Thermoprotei archaeon]|nr:MAG: 5-formyltetrahydrofolate cyclo-ligase [Thermoprotei archaeon]